MAKTDYEIAGELTQELFKARGVAISGANVSAGVHNYTNDLLTAEAVASAYKLILQGVREGING
ncbi:hypothetical protein D3C76_598660 [compost metagenome]